MVGRTACLLVWRGHRECPFARVRLSSLIRARWSTLPIQCNAYALATALNPWSVADRPVCSAAADTEQVLIGHLPGPPASA